MFPLTPTLRQRIYPFQRFASWAKTVLTKREFTRSTLSHDFYQVMIGRADMTLHGWRQLVEWSLQHSCMSTEERQGVLGKWELMWEEFLDWIIAEYGSGHGGVDSARA